MEIEADRELELLPNARSIRAALRCAQDLAPKYQRELESSDLALYYKQSDGARKESRVCEMLARRLRAAEVFWAEVEGGCG
jgi:hypothetical protein